MSRFVVKMASFALLALVLPMVSHAQNQAADEARRQNMMNEMRTNDYNNDQRNNTPSQSTYHSTTNSGSGTGTHDSSTPASFAKPYQYVPEGPHSVVATYEFTVFKQESESETIARLRAEAQDGNAQSQFNMGRIYYTGYGVARDDAEARHWFCEAAKQDHPIAKSQCAAMLYNGQGGADDKPLAMAYLKDAAQKGDPYGEALYGFFTYQDGVYAGTMVADGQSIAYLVDAADHGEVVAQLLLGGTIFYFKGPTQDMPRAVKYLRMCDAKGTPACTGFLGYMTYYGEGGLAADHEKGLAMLVRASDAGHEISCGVVANIYNDRNGGYYDEAKTLKYARLGAGAANPDAASVLVLGIYTYLGVSVPQDQVEGRRLIRKAADLGDPQGEFYVGEFYYNGEGTQKNDVEAVRWYRLAADGHMPGAAEKLQQPDLIEAAKQL